ncbi:MAG: flagellar brake protein [Alkaliphilus sp.]
MTIISELEIGIKLEISRAIETDQRGKKAVTSQLLDKNEEYLFISQPIFKGLPYQIDISNKIKIIFNHKDKGTFSIIGEVINKKTNKVTIYCVKPINEPVVVQRREYFRIDMLKNVIIRDLKNNDQINCYSKNVSGGGIKLICNKKIETGKLVECKLYFKEGHLITTVGKVLKASKCMDDTKYEINLEFENISDVTRNRIIAFIFEYQRLLRKRGLI